MLAATRTTRLPAEYNAIPCGAFFMMVRCREMAKPKLVVQLSNNRCKTKIIAKGNAKFKGFSLLLVIARKKSNLQDSLFNTEFSDSAIPPVILPITTV